MVEHLSMVGTTSPAAVMTAFTAWRWARINVAKHVPRNAGRTTNVLLFPCRRAWAGVGCGDLFRPVRHGGPHGPGEEGVDVPGRVQGVRVQGQRRGPGG